VRTQISIRELRREDSNGKAEADREAQRYKKQTHDPKAVKQNSEGAHKQKQPVK
jgi:hypothetical protein